MKCVECGCENGCRCEGGKPPTYELGEAAWDVAVGLTEEVARLRTELIDLRARHEKLLGALSWAAWRTF